MENNRPEDSSASPEGFSSFLEEILVTATKRKERLKDVPLSISVVGNQDIRDRNLVGMSDVLNSLPSVSVLDQGPGYNSLILRGIAAQPQTDGVINGAATGNTLTGVYIGETPISGLGVQGNSSDLKFIDIERVEVLRGPQGTLYGGGAMGGIVRNIPTAPNLEKFEGNATAVYSNTARRGGDDASVQGIVNLPLVNDKLALRAVGYYSDNSGYYRNIAGSDPTSVAAAALYGGNAFNRGDIGASTYAGWRATLLWKPIDPLSITLMSLRQKIEGDGWGQADLAAGSDGYTQIRFQMRPDSPPNYGQPVENEGIDDDLRVTNLVVDYDLGWASLLSSSSYLKADNSLRREISQFFADADPTTLTPPVSQPISYISDSVIQELRLTSDLQGPLQFLVGAYYDDREVTTNNAVLFGGDPAVLPVLFFTNAGIVDTKQKALFGEVSYNLFDRMTMTIGARYFNFDGTSRLFFNSAPFSTIDNSEDGSTLKAGLEYRPNDQAMIYSSWSQGFRLGYPVGPNPLASCDLDQDGFYDGSNGLTMGSRRIDSDSTDNYEVGGKLNLLGGRLQVNGALYRIDWTGIPVNIFFGNCTAVVAAGKARSEGIELETSFAVREGLKLNFSGSYIEAQITSSTANLSAGDRLPGSPRYNLSTGVQYDYEILGRHAYSRADFTVLGGYYNNPQQTGVELGNYGMLNLASGIQINDVRLAVFIQNATNEDELIWVDTDSIAGRGNRLRPRVIGLRVGIDF